MAVDPQLAEEQEHLDLTYAAYDALLDALSVSRRDRQGDAFTEEVLERMRVERLRAYGSAAGARQLIASRSLPSSATAWRPT